MKTDCDRISTHRCLFNKEILIEAPTRLEGFAKLDSTPPTCPSQVPSNRLRKVEIAVCSWSVVQVSLKTSSTRHGDLMTGLGSSETKLGLKVGLIQMTPTHSPRTSPTGTSPSGESADDSDGKENAGNYARLSPSPATGNFIYIGGAPRWLHFSWLPFFGGAGLFLIEGNLFGGCLKTVSGSETHLLRTRIKLGRLILQSMKLTKYNIVI